MKGAGENVLVVQPLLAHYRFGVLSQLGVQSGVRYVIAAGGSGADGDIECFSGDRLHRFVPLVNKRIGSFLWQQGLLRLALRREFAAVVFPGGVHDISTWVAAVAARIAGKRVMFWTTGWTRPEYGAKRLLRLFFYRTAHRLLIYGVRGRDIGVQAGYPPARITVIYNSQESPVKTADSGTRLEKVPDSSDPIILFVGRLNADKGVDLLFRSLKLIPRNVRVVVVGDGPEKERLERLASELGISARFYGAVYGRQSLAPIYEGATLTVAPGRVGLTAVQSIEFGVPVICSDDPDGQPAEWDAVIGGVTGGHFRAGDVASLAATVDQWLEILAYDSARYSRFCRSEFADKWTATSHARRIEDAVRLELNRERGHA